MRRFTVLAPSCTEQDRKAWEDAGFLLIQNKTDSEPEQPPELVFWNGSLGQSETAWQYVTQAMPKLFVIVSGHKSSMPEHLTGIYELQCIAGEGICFSIGSRLQEQVAVPDRQAYRNDGPLTREEQIKAVADSVYRYLLQDVFRETAEWCGHMSSVVGPA
ncbi:MAG: hypothetical protein K6U74_11505 [Firmicutes bacterium]|nr:hypothetical protein [Bacillota bacterium]